MLLIGSMALQRRGFTHQSEDMDLIATFEELNTFTRELRTLSGIKILSKPVSRNKTILCVKHFSLSVSYVEVEIAWPGSTAEELLRGSSDKITPSVWWNPQCPSLKDCKVASLDILYTLKMSHRFLKNSVHFEKTMKDIKYLRVLGAKICDEAWLERREAETYAYDHPKLNTTKSSFFKNNDGVRYIYDHDSIHVAMAHFGENLDRSDRIPAYKMYAGDGEVISSKKKFFGCIESTRLYGVLEEAQVLALERSQIPYGAGPRHIYHTRQALGIKNLERPPSPRQSFEMALEKVCTSITSGWFRDYAWENHNAVLGMYEPDYVDKFWRAVELGTVFRTPQSKAQEEEYDRRRDSGDL